MDLEKKLNEAVMDYLRTVNVFSSFWKHKYGHPFKNCPFVLYYESMADER